MLKKGEEKKNKKRKKKLNVIISSVLYAPERVDDVFELNGHHT